MVSRVTAVRARLLPRRVLSSLRERAIRGVSGDPQRRSDGHANMRARVLCLLQRITEASRERVLTCHGYSSEDSLRCLVLVDEFSFSETVPFSMNSEIMKMRPSGSGARDKPR